MHSYIHVLIHSLGYIDLIIIFTFTFIFIFIFKSIKKIMPAI